MAAPPRRDTPNPVVYDTKPMKLRVGDTVYAGWGKYRTVWLVLSVNEPGGRRLKMRTAPRDPRKRPVTRCFPWHDVENGRFFRTNGVPIKEYKP